ncbi:hypothetical protein TrRE_jg7740 [Triparma retinervis]|uniref:Fe2OG dioxygenase domain-containing protein n=1 Tax=Triparma retinervis TaxID=2557542 RepID=A0A9W6ZAJ0_9STRA|nr:hypothetical protein TrRE_jg7740 [Triparma retinervis]
MHPRPLHILRSLSYILLLLLTPPSLSVPTSDPPNSDVTSTLTSSPNVTSPSARNSDNYISRIASCYNLARPATLLATGRRYPELNANDGHFQIVEELRTYSSMCFRSAPYNQLKMLNSSLTADDYLDGIREEGYSLTLSKNEQVQDLFHIEGELAIDRIDDPVDPSRLNGRGNMVFTSIHQLEHFVDQLEYLVALGKLPPRFQSISETYKHVIVPQVAAELRPSCVYFTRFDQSPSCSIPGSPSIRQQYFILHDWMINRVYATHNRILHLPVQPERNHVHPFALNPDLDFESIELEFSSGNVLAIDDFLTPVGLTQLYNLALESTVFFDAKKGYLGAYLDDGLSSPWLRYLVRELQERLPGVLGGLPLKQAWMYKYDSDADMKGINIHADQAAVNLNIWLTPDEANLDPETGGLVVYNTLPPLAEVDGSGTFKDWNDYGQSAAMKDFLKGKGSKVARVPYRRNRCVMFNSALLHETDEFNFRGGYKDRRINLTLLFGSVGEQMGTDEAAKVGEDGERYLKGDLIYL